MDNALVTAIAGEIVKQLGIKAPDAHESGLTLEQRKAIADKIGATLPDAKAPDANQNQNQNANQNGNGSGDNKDAKGDDPLTQLLTQLGGGSAFKPGTAKDGLSVETLKSMTPEQINENWGEISKSLPAVMNGAAA